MLPICPMTKGMVDPRSYRKAASIVANREAQAFALPLSVASLSPWRNRMPSMCPARCTDLVNAALVDAVGRLPLADLGSTDGTHHEVIVWGSRSWSTSSPNVIPGPAPFWLSLGLPQRLGCDPHDFVRQTRRCGLLFSPALRGSPRPSMLD